MAFVTRAHVIIHGRVQGVGFRYHTLREALAAGVAGWVRNLPGGSVEAVFEGPKTNVERVVDWCRSGPGFASVARVDEEWEDVEPMFKGFNIR